MILLLLPLAGGLARADEPPKPPPAPPAAPAPEAKPAPPPTPEQAADAALAAVKAKDDAALKVLAAKDAPDPWLVADELVRRGELDAADAFAKAAPRVDVEKLPEYVASRRGKPDDPARRERLTKANAALAAKNAPAALAALGAADAASPTDVVGIRFAFGRGMALQILKRLDESATALLVAADAAERVGWLARAFRVLTLAGLSAYDHSDFQGALSAWKRRLAIEEARGDRLGVAAALSNIGEAYREMHRLPEALEYDEKARKMFDDLGDRAWLAVTLGNMGLVYRSLGNYGKAFEVQERALALMEEVGDREEVARMLANIGDMHESLGNYPKALEYDERALKIKEELGDKAGAAGSRINIGNVYDSLGDYAKALEYYERGLEEAEAVGQRQWAANALGGIGVVYLSLGDFAKALATQERALAAFEALGDKAGAAHTLGNIGNVYYSLGDYAKARATYERALAALEALGDKAGAAATLGNIGGVHFALGDSAKALATFERALAAKEALGDMAGAAGTLANIGGVHFALGNYPKALECQERALKMLEDGGNHAGAALTRANIGSVHCALGDYPKALECLERALKAFEDLGERAHAATILGNIAAAHHALGDDEKALATYERVLAAQAALGDKAGAALTLGNIGTVYGSLGDTANAIKFLERAVQASGELGASRLLVDALRKLAAVRLKSGDAGLAIESAHTAVSLLKTLVGGLGEEQGATAREQYTSLFATGLVAAAKTGDAPEAAFFLESGRSGTLLEALESRGALRAALIPESLRLADVQARGREARALGAYQKSLDGGDLAAIRARDEELKAARAGVVEVVERIQREAKRAAQVVYPVAARLSDIQGFLAPGEALVLYGLADRDEVDEVAHALVLTKEGARIVALGKSTEIVTACEALDAKDPDADPAPALATLRDLVVKPLGLAKETKRLLVSPEGPLSYVPFAALVPDLVVAYEQSGTTYGVLREEKDKHGEQVLALADADYTAKYEPIALDLYAPLAVAKAGPTRGGRLAALPGTREEAKAIADVALYGKDACEPGLRDALRKRKDRWHAVHFACHGLVNPDRPTLSSLALTPKGEDDGFLTALEVLKMEIPSDLVVLSACETGTGKIVGGEGIVGLTRAFMYAGSPRVICSLWKVDDEATKALMTKFYELWNPKDGKPGLPTAEALRKAQEFVRDDPKHPQWKHPYYWAAWVLWGLPE